MAKYLDPKADLTFKKVFGEHKNLVISLLNALLPLDEGKKVESIEYLPPEMVPQTPDRKNSVVDVRCMETGGRLFIVEMQLSWTTEFKQRVMFNAAKAYVKQLGRRKRFKLLQPVYSLNLVNAVFEPDVEDYYHYYKMVHYQHSEKMIDGLQLVFVELPKFKPRSFAEKKMQVLWLRFLTEIGEETAAAPKELLDNPEVAEALEIVEESAYSDEEIDAYDRFWDGVRREVSIVEAEREAKEELSNVRREVASAKEEAATAKEEAATAKDEAATAKEEAATAKEEAATAKKKAAEVEAKLDAAVEKLDAAAEKLRQTARNLKAMGLSSDQIAKVTSLTVAEVDGL